MTDKQNKPQVDKGVPFPDNSHILGRTYVYPFQDMQVGDSFFVAQNARAVIASIGRFSRRHGGKFTLRTVTENGVKGTRVWRIK